MHYTGYIRALVFAIYMCQAQARGPCVMCSELGCSCSCTCIYLLVCGTGRPREGDPTSCTLYGFNSARRQHTATRPHRASAARDADHGRLPAAYSQRPLSCNLAQSQLSTRRERSPPASRAVRALVLLAMSLSSLSFWSCPCHPCLPCPFGHVLVILVFSEGKVVIF